MSRAGLCRDGGLELRGDPVDGKAQRAGGQQRIGRVLGWLFGGWTAAGRGTDR